ncbi:MAG: S4 domain-containing protein, partial [Verrucomicrobiota bacterium]
FEKAMSVSDELMWDYFSLVLCRPTDEIAALKQEIEAGKSPMDAKFDMSQAIVEKFYDAEAGVAAREEWIRLHRNKEKPADMPSVELPDVEIGLLTLIVTAGLAPSNGEARRLVQQGGVKLNDEKMTDPRAMITPVNGHILQVGKRKFAELVVE